MIRYRYQLKGRIPMNQLTLTEKSYHGLTEEISSAHIVLTISVAVSPLVSKPCFACILCRYGSICQMKESKMPYMTVMQCRSFMHIDFNEQQVPDATTLLNFRHMLEKNGIGEKIFADVNACLDKAGLMMHGGTIVDASLIVAPKSTKNREGKRIRSHNKRYICKCA